MRSVLFAQVRTHAARLVASTLAIVLAVGFVVATLVLNETSRSTLLQAAGARYVGTDAVVTSTDGTAVEADLLKGLSAVQAVAPEHETIVQAVVPGRGGTRWMSMESFATDPVLRWQHLVAGAFPVRAGQVAVSERAGAAVGDILLLTVPAGDGATSNVQATVVGVVDLGADPAAGLSGGGYVTAEQAVTWGALPPVELRVAGGDDLLTQLTEALADQPVSVRTGTERAELAAAELTGDNVQLTAVLLVFATVAVLVAGLVIANTFAVLLAQRTQELALLRCVGATARQVRRSLLGEALVTGLVASAVGVLAGVGLAAGVCALAAGTDSPVPLAGLAVPPAALLVGLAVGTLVTLLAALAPARAATRVAPLAALRPTDPAPLRSRPGRARLVLGLAMLVPGVAVLVLGVTGVQVLTAVAGGALSFLGVVVLAQRFLPPVVAAAGALVARVGGVPAELAAGNATRNPRRTAATAVALLIGVTLTTAMVVGAASTRATGAAELAAAYPTDVVVDGTGEPLPAGLLDQLRAVDGVAGATALVAEDLIGPDGQPVRVQGVDSDAAAPVLRSAGELPRGGQVVLPPYLADTWSIGDGEAVALRGSRGSLSLLAVVGSSEVSLPRVSVAELAAVAPDAAVDALWLRLADEGTAAQTRTVDQVTELAGSAAPSTRTSGLVSERAALDEVLDALLLVVTGLLGVAVVIALIGVGNTLALSVVERRQENGLLRALGLTRRQLRSVLAWEAVLVAAVAALLGVLLGVGYGLAGTASVLGDFVLVLTVPWLQVAVIVVLAALAGLLASVLPARRAARTAPVAALAS